MLAFLSLEVEYFTTRVVSVRFATVVDSILASSQAVAEIDYWPQLILFSLHQPHKLQSHSIWFRTQIGFLNFWNFWVSPTFNCCLRRQRHLQFELCHRRSQREPRGPEPPNWNANNDKNVTKKTIVFSVSVPFSIISYNSTRVQQ